VTQATRLNLGGVDSLLFQITPSAFTLTVNNYCLTNISYMFIVSRRLGFPYPKKMYYLEDGIEAVADMSYGMERVLSPVIRKAIEEKGKIFFQPIFKGGLVSGEHIIKLYDTEYVKAHSIDHDNGIGDIFQENNGKILHYKKGDLISLEPHPVFSENELGIRSAINIRNWQKWLLTLNPNNEGLNVDHQKYIKDRNSLGLQLNIQMTEHLKRLLERK